MKNSLPLLLSTLSFCGIGAVVFMRLAHRFGLQDHPNGRSSHRDSTVTGMGIILVLAFIMYLFWRPFELSGGFVLGFFLLTVISFLDDMFFLKHSVRLFFQVFCILIMVMQLPFQSTGIESMAIGLAAVVFAVGVLNAYNFMDGINGMLTLHTLWVLTCFLYINESLTDIQGQHIHFTNSHFLVSIIIPMAVFGFFNIRNKALAFFGDVGSIGIAFIIIYLMFLLLLRSGNYAYLLLFSVFGADAGLTVVYKLILRENIFVPHRDFLFKKLVHIRKLPHLAVSFIFLAVQMVISLIVIFALPKNPKLSTQMSVLFIVVVALVAVYIWGQSMMSRRKSNDAVKVSSQESEKK